jgi:hypothetical protein
MELLHDRGRGTARIGWWDALDHVFAGLASWLIQDTTWEDTGMAEVS